MTENTTVVTSPVKFRLNRKVVIGAGVGILAVAALVATKQLGAASEAADAVKA